MKGVEPRLAGIDRDEVPLGPQTVHIDVINGCNTNCITCWDHSPLLTHARSAEWKRKRVALADIERLLDDIATLGGLKAIIVSGMGEPFVHPDIYQLIAAIKARGLHLTIITNLVAGDPQRIIDLQVDELLIGVQGASEASYLAFHPNFLPHHWRDLQDALEQFRQARRRFKHVQVIADVNAHELTAMVELAHRYEARQVNFKLASLKDGTEACRISDHLRQELLAQGVPSAQSRARELDVATNLSVFRDQLQVGGAATAPIRDVGCFMGHYYSRITVDGTVLYCCNTDVRVGSLRDGQRFSELWRGEAWTALRARLRSGEYFASCSQCGKLNQNVKLAKRFEALYGRDRLLAVTGRTPGVEA